MPTTYSPPQHKPTEQPAAPPAIAGAKSAAAKSKAMMNHHHSKLLPSSNKTTKTRSTAASTPSPAQSLPSDPVLATHNLQAPPLPRGPLDAFLYEQTRLVEHLERRFDRYEKRSKEQLDKFRARKKAAAPSLRKSSKPTTPTITQKPVQKQRSSEPVLLPKSTPLPVKTDLARPSEKHVDTPRSSPTSSHQTLSSPWSSSASSSPTMAAPTLRMVARRAAGPSTLPPATVSPASSRAHLSTTASTRASAGSRKRSKVVSNPDSLPLAEAVRVLRALEIANPSSAFALELTTKYSKSSLPLRGRVALPTDARRAPDVILVFADSESPSAEAARAAGAHFVGGQELFPKVLSGEITPTKVLSTPGLLPTVAKQLARFLGPKGLMPVAKRGTVGEGETLGELIREAGGSIEWRADKLGVVRSPVARMTFTPPAIHDNVRAFIAAVREGSASAAASNAPLARTKRTSTILRARLETTNGPSIELNDVL